MLISCTSSAAAVQARSTMADTQRAQPIDGASNVALADHPQDDKEDPPYDADTQAFLDQCRDKLDRLEALRLDKKRTYETRKKIGKPAAVVLTPVLGFVDYLAFRLMGGEDAFVAVTIAGLALLWGWVTQPKRAYARAYKTKILPEIAGLFGDLSYDPKGKIKMDALRPSKIIPGHTAYTSEDYFSGVYRDVQIEFSEIMLRRQQGRSSKTVFDGLAIMLSYEAKTFAGHTVLVRDTGKVGAWFKASSLGLERADLTDPVFEDLFDVFTSDQVEARFLLDPAIIENIRALYLAYDGVGLSAAFFEDRALILIGSRKNHFEPASIDKPASSPESLLSMRQEVGQILSIIDRLALYDRYGAGADMPSAHDVIGGDAEANSTEKT